MTMTPSEIERRFWDTARLDNVWEVAIYCHARSWTASIRLMHPARDYDRDGQTRAAAMLAAMRAMKEARP